MFIDRREITVTPLDPQAPTELYAPQDLSMLLLDPQMPSYGVVDASRVFGLRERLEADGIPFRCLFTGDAAEEFADVAPYLFAIEDGSSLLRDLFTSAKQSGRPSGLWEAQPGVFLRSRAGFEALHRHLRQFTKLRDAAGAWVYFRFYEPWVLDAYLGAIAGYPERLAGFMTTREGAPIEFITRRRVHTPSQALLVQAGLRAAQVIDAPVTDAFRRAKWDRFIDMLVPAVQAATSAPESGPGPDPARIRALARQAKAGGHLSERAIYTYACAAIIAERAGARMDEIEREVDPERRLTGAERADAMLTRAQERAKDIWQGA